MVVAGSFVTRKEVPSDVDALYVIDELRMGDLDNRFRDSATRRIIYMGDYLPTRREDLSIARPGPFFRLFLTDRDGKVKGFLSLDPAELM